MSTKLLAGHIEVWAFAPEAQTDWTVIDASQLNAAIAAGAGWVISCAIEDGGYELGTTGYSESDARSICDIGNVSSPQFAEYGASLDGFRSDPDDPTTVYDTFYELFSQPGRTFYLMSRVGPAQGTALAAGQIVSAFGFETDYGVDIVADNEMLMWGARFLPNGNLNTNKTVIA